MAGNGWNFFLICLESHTITELHNWTFKFNSKSLALIALALFSPGMPPDTVYRDTFLYMSCLLLLMGLSCWMELLCSLLVLLLAAPAWRRGANWWLILAKLNFSPRANILHEREVMEQE